VETIERLEFPAPAPRHTTPLLLQHGLFLGAAAWERTAKVLSEECGWNVFATSLPGHGGSTMHKLELAFYNVEDYVNPLARQVQRFTAPPVLVAHDAAALFAQRMLEQREHASHEIAGLAALALVAPTPPEGVGSWLARYRKRNSLHTLAKRPAANPERFFDSESRARNEWLAPGDTTPTEQWFPRLQGESRQVIEQLDRGVKLAPRRSTPPTRVFVAEHDAWYERAELEPLVQSFAAGVEVVPGAGHGVMLGQAAADLARRLDAWLVAAGVP
jgi:pimeloyl-ACP methyl ester carboxylesterase